MEIVYKVWKITKEEKSLNLGLRRWTGSLLGVEGRQGNLTEEAAFVKSSSYEITWPVWKIASPKISIEDFWFGVLA